jgi:hypothetical protein
LQTKKTTLKTKGEPTPVHCFCYATFGHDIMNTEAMSDFTILGQIDKDTSHVNEDERLVLIAVVIQSQALRRFVNGY